MREGQLAIPVLGSSDKTDYVGYVRGFQVYESADRTNSMPVRKINLAVLAWRLNPKQYNNPRTEEQRCMTNFEASPDCFY